MADIKSPIVGGETSPDPILTFLDVAANTLIEGGRLVWSDASGYAIPSSSAVASSKCWGICDERADNRTSNTPYGAAGAKKVTVRQGIALVTSSDGTGVRAAVGSAVYLVSDTGTGAIDVSTDDAGGTRPLVGGIVPNPRGSTDPSDASKVPVRIAALRPDVNNPLLAVSRATAFEARVVATTVPAYTGSKTATLTVTATGALSAIDGVTPAAGDVLFFAEGATNLTDPADAGPWLVSVAGATSVHPVLIRPDWYPHGGSIGQAVIEIGGEGTGTAPRFAGGTWKAFSAKGTIIGTDAPLFYPQATMGTFTAASGVVLNASSLFPVRSATTSQVSATNQGTASHASTVGPPRVTATITAGAIGTSSITMKAESAPGTVNASDVGVYCVRVANW